MALEIILLGTGTSHGVPMIGCRCPVCTSADPRDRRNRCAAAVRTPGGEVILIDAPPELRLACIAFGIDRCDAILLTHSHADHIMGLDDVRRFNELSRRTLPLYADQETVDRVKVVFDYAIASYERVGGGRPSLTPLPITGPMRICGLDIIPIPLLHGPMSVLGFRIGDFAYLTDVSDIPESSRALLVGLDTLVLDALRHRPHPTHFNLVQALEVVDVLRPRRTLLTHLTHDVPHEATQKSLPPGVELGYDGQRIEMT